MPGNRFVDILNEKYNAEEVNRCYTVSQDSFYLPEIIKCFRALISEFPDSESIVLETGTTKFANEEWLDALNQVEYDESELGYNIVDQLSLEKRMSIFIKEKMPLLSILKKQMSQIIRENDATQTKTDSQPYTSEQIKNVEAAMKLLRQEYTSDLYILYHPSVSINPDGTLCIKEEETLEQFRKVCRENNIAFIDMTDAFYAAYRDSDLLPYGFNNTSMGKGHINKYGHRLIADALYDAMEGGER